MFLITEETSAAWLRRIDEEGEHALVQTPEPVNRFPDFVGYLVRWLKSMGDRTVLSIDEGGVHPADQRTPRTIRHA